MNDSDGESIVNDREYAVRIISVATDDEETMGSISGKSNDLLLGVFTIKVSYMGNMGIVISDVTKQVIIDGVHGNASGWYQATASSLNALINGSTPWGNSDILMTSHNHGDHFL